MRYHIHRARRTVFGTGGPSEGFVFVPVPHHTKIPPPPPNDRDAEYKLCAA